jgi:hypothetical protein
MNKYLKNVIDKNSQASLAFLQKKLYIGAGDPRATLDVLLLLGERLREREKSNRRRQILWPFFPQRLLYLTFGRSNSRSTEQKYVLPCSRLIVALIFRGVACGLLCWGVLVVR